MFFSIRAICLGQKVFPIRVNFTYFAEIFATPLKWQIVEDSLSPKLTDDLKSSSLYSWQHLISWPCSHPQNAFFFELMDTIFALFSSLSCHSFLVFTVSFSFCSWPLHFGRPRDNPFTANATFFTYVILITSSAFNTVVWHCSNSYRSLLSFILLYSTPFLTSLFRWLQIILILTYLKLNF